MALKVGDVVMLKSGGPLMTVIRLYNTRLGVAWFDHMSASGSHEETFPEAALKLHANSGTPIKAVA